MANKTAREHCYLLTILGHAYTCHQVRQNWIEYEKKNIKTKKLIQINKIIKYKKI